MKHTRECLGRLVERSITADGLINESLSIAATPPPCAAATDQFRVPGDWAAERVCSAFVTLADPAATATLNGSAAADATNAPTSTASGRWPKPAS